LSIRRARGVQELAAVEAALVHVLDPLDLDLARAAAEFLRLVRADGEDGVAAIGGSLAPGDVAALLDLAEPGRGGHAGVGVDDLLEVGRQRVVLVLVHRHDERRGVERAAGRVELGVELGELVHLDRRHHFPGNDAALDGALGQRVRDLRQRHADRRGAQRAHQLGDLARGGAHLQAAHVAHALDRLLGGVDDARAVHLQRDDLRVLELVGRHRLHVLPVRLGRGLGVGHHEGQLEHLDAREAAGRVAGQGPDDVDDAVARLVVQLHRRAAQLHGGVALELDAAAGVLLDLVHPGLVHVQPDVGLRRHEGVELERDGSAARSR
jgi:hypothetical protein